MQWLDKKTTIHALRKLTSASEMPWICSVLACFLQREKVMGWRPNSVIVF